MTFRVGDPLVNCHLIIKKGREEYYTFACKWRWVFLRLYSNLLTHFRLKSKARVDPKKKWQENDFPIWKTNDLGGTSVFKWIAVHRR